MVEQRAEGVPKARLDALTDGVFAFAMTLLVINLQFPSEVKISTSAELLNELYSQTDAFLAYAISFFVLAVRWIAVAKGRQSDLTCSYHYAWAVLMHLFLVTLIPFSTMLVGSYGDMWPVIWVYGVNTALSAVASARATALLKREEGLEPQRPDLGLVVLIGSAVLSVAISLVSPSLAMLAYLLNLVAPMASRMLR